MRVVIPAPIKALRAGASRNRVLHHRKKLLEKFVIFSLPKDRNIDSNYNY